MKLIKSNEKGFTLIELLVVIAIIAVLSVVVILTLNPAELLRQARDSSRISDFATMKSAISLFQADVATSSVNALGTPTTTFATAGVTTATPSGANSYVSLYGNLGWGFTSSTGGAAVAGNYITSSSNRGIGGQGWIPINFTAISSGAPIGNEPVDPVNNNTNYYTYAVSSTAFKMATKVESTKYSLGGGGDVVSNDGGNSTGTFEAGTNPAL